VDSSSEFLSQEEVDALLRGVTGEEDEPETPTEEEEGGIRPYNLATQERIVRGRMPTMELINERFARYLRVGLFNFVRRNIEVSVGALHVQKYGEFLRNLVIPTNLNLVQAKPFRGNGLIVMEPNLIFLIVDILFGGDGRFHTRIEGRDFSPTEQRIILGLLNVIFEDYQRAWAPVYKIELGYVRSEMNPQFASIATPSEIVVASQFVLDLGVGQANLHICWPYSMLEPVRDLLYSTMQSDQMTHDSRWTRNLARRLVEAEVTLNAVLGHGRLTLGDLVDLRVGDVIPIEIPELVTVYSDGVPVIRGHYGTRNKHYAVKIHHFVAEEEPPDDPPNGAPQEVDETAESTEE
jgi:flagellar motor switch protein FliM